MSRSRRRVMSTFVLFSCLCPSTAGENSRAAHSEQRGQSEECSVARPTTEAGWVLVMVSCAVHIARFLIV